MTPLSDEQLVKFFQKGDKQHFKILYQRYYQTIVNFLYQNIRDPEMAEELAQETFLKAYKGLDVFKGKSSFKNWLYTIARNKFVDYLRKKQRNPRHAPIDELSKNEIIDISDEEIINPETDFLNKEQLAVVNELIDKLNEEEKTAISLVSERFSYKKISKILGSSTGRVGSLISEARKKLAKGLKKYEFFSSNKLSLKQFRKNRKEQNPE